MKVVVNPEYKHLEGFLVEALSHSYNADNVYRNFRNIVEDVNVDGLRVVVKIFKKPTEFNRVIYSFLRPTKAKRSRRNRLLILTWYACRCARSERSSSDRISSATCMS